MGYVRASPISATLHLWDILYSFSCLQNINFTREELGEQDISCICKLLILSAFKLSIYE